jgi:hypothetical protein
VDAVCQRCRLPERKGAQHFRRTSTS